ncbi:MAG TPA: dihydrofolate reductase family protein, partial [Parvularculaceae bacterium]|nr:dihydrofolate reductase family protein [Parvularculaceae bacterium]
PKYVASKTLNSLGWSQSSLLSGDLRDEVMALKNKPGKAIGVHGSISLVQTLLDAGLIDELKLVICPAIAGQGRCLFSRDGDPIQLDLQSAQTTPGGLQFLVFRPRA